MAVPKLRIELARDGIFNTRDLGGMTTVDGATLTPGRVFRADALQRVKQAAAALKASGITRVIDLRGDEERERSGVLDVEGVEVIHHSVLDPTFGWTREGDLVPTEVLRSRYQEILEVYGSRFTAAISEIAEVIDDHSEGPHAVAFHCALGKDRTGILAALLLSLLGITEEQIVLDYTRSANSTAVQLQWLWSFGYIGDEVADEDLTQGLWSARPETLRSMLTWIEDQFGSSERYVVEHGLDNETIEVLRQRLLVKGDSDARNG